MSFQSLPITSSLGQSVPQPKAPWRISRTVSARLELKPLEGEGTFSRTVLLPDDPELDFVKSYFFASKPVGLGIRSVFCIDNPQATQAFEGALSGMEADAKKTVFKPNWPQEKGADAKKSVHERWARMANLFGPFKLNEQSQEIKSAKALPLWHGADLDKSFSIASGGFTFFGKHHFFDPKAVKGKTSSTDSGYFGSGIYFTDSAHNASMYSPTHLVMAWVIMREPLPVINDLPHPQQGTDMAILRGKGAYQNYNAHFIPVSSIAPQDSACMEYYPCYQGQAPAWDEVVVFEKAQAVARIWVELTPDGPMAPLSQPYSQQEAMLASERGDLNLLKKWIGEDQKRLQNRTKEGETLIYAALSGHQLEVIQWLFNQDPSLIHQCRNDKRSIPFLTVLFGDKEILTWLVEQGVTYSSTQFSQEAKALGYSTNRIAAALQNVGWSIWQIPPRNPHFTGRESTMDALKERFKEDPTKVFAQVALIGSGGMGKSSLASEYAHRFQNIYSIVWWLDAEQSVVSGLKRLGEKLEIVHSETPDQEVIESVVRYLEKHTGWLLICDNAGSPSELAPYLPKFGGHVLVTTRNNTWKNRITLEGFNEDESVTLLTTTTGYLPTQEASTLAKELGHLPLAITQAGAYMAETATAYANYLGIYRSERAALLESQSLPADYPYSVTTTWKVSLDKIRMTSPSSLQLLYRALFLAPDNISKELLNTDSLTPRALNDIFKPLLAYSLLSSGSKPETFTIHRLTQTTLRDRLSSAEANKAKSSLAEHFAKVWQFNGDAKNWKNFASLVPHLEAFVELGANEQDRLKYLFDLSNYYRLADVNLSKAMEFAQQEMKLSAKILGTDHPRYANSLSGLAKINIALGHELEAINLENRSLAIKMGRLGENHPDVAASLDNLGSALCQKGDHNQTRQAIEVLKRSIAIKQMNRLVENADFAITLNNLGLAYQGVGEMELAFKAMTHAHTINRRIFGDLDLNVAGNIVNIGTIYSVMGTHGKAIEYYKAGLKTFEKLLGDAHPDVAKTFYCLAKVYFDQKNFQESSKFCEKALDIFKKNYGEVHPEVARTIGLMGLICSEQLDWKKARDLFREALKIHQELYQNPHPHIAIDFQDIATTYSAEGSFHLAVGNLVQAVDVAEKASGEDHPSVAGYLKNLGQAYSQQREMRKAAECFGRAFTIYRTAFGDHHPATAELYRMLQGAQQFSNRR